MRKLGVLLALIVLGSLLTVGTGSVRADTSSGYQFIVREYYLDTVNISATSVQDSNIWLPSGSTLSVQVEPGQDYIDYVFSVSTLSDLYALFVYDRTNKMQFEKAINDVKTQLNITYTLSSTEYYINGLSGVTKIYAYGVVKGANWIGSNTFIGEVQLSNATTVAFAGFDLRSDSSDEAVGVYGIPDMGVYNFSDASTWFGVAAVHSKATSNLGVSEDKGLQTRTGVHVGIALKIYDYWNSKYTGGAATIVIFGNGDTVVSKSGFTVTNQLDVIPYTDNVQFSLKDALSGQSLSGVTVKDTDGTVLGTVDDGGTLELTKGTHTLTFEKNGYWSVTKTIDVQGDTSLSVQMYPSSAAFTLENFPTNISIPENTIYTLTFTLSPITTDATHNTYLSISGLQNLVSVEKDGSVVSPESGKYYLGDISGPTQVSIKFKAGAVGQHGFTIAVESHDAIQSKTYTTTKSVAYQVEPLPFSVQMPSEWQVGQNELIVSESSGQSYLITAILKDSQGNEVWSDSYAFSPYEAHTFKPKIPKEGSYTLDLQWNGQTAEYSIQVNPAITLKTKTLTVQKGSEGAIVIHFKNPSSDVQYYTIVVSGGFLSNPINQSISVAPLTEKNVSIAFAVPDHLEYDAYELNVVVDQGNAQVFQDKVAVSISGSSGFHLLGGGNSHGRVFIYLLAGLLVAGLAVVMVRRR
ncbi:hypothetical protein [Thermococcus sp. Bubb.Bath]|uniref:hypothetical protein n=1 Tax=Thermococcus sp. Bubb.Bath TaxID=1638242 RepID=UPI001F0E02B0|nr:hypothetical protein [Thermococcus sp. Bubb.Bath]